MKKHDFEVGQKVFIRTVTHHYVGVVEEILEMGVVLKQAAWVADDGRFSTCARGVWDSRSEVEPFPPDKRVTIYFGGLIDSWLFDGELLTTPK